MRIHFDVFDEKCGLLGKYDETARAELAGVDRTTLWRWRKGRQQPSLTAVMHIASELEISIEELTGQKKAA